MTEAPAREAPTTPLPARPERLAGPLAAPLAALTCVSAAAWAYVAWGPAMMTRAARHVPDWLYLPLLSGAHVLTFALWTPAFVWLARRATGRRWTPAMLLIPAAAAVASELAQAWLPRHDPDWRGALSSLAGVLVGLAIAARLRSNR